jgi:hypothetical protein
MGLGRTSADGGDVSPKLGRKSKLTQSPLKSEAHVSCTFRIYVSAG